MPDLHLVCDAERVLKWQQRELLTHVDNARRMFEEHEAITLEAAQEVVFPPRLEADLAAGEPL